MNSLRKHLEAERDAYQNVRYPGDLAREILPVPVIPYGHKHSLTRSPWFLIASALAAAALIAIALPMWHRWMAPVGPTIARYNDLGPYQSPPDEQMPFVLDTTESMPSDVPMIPTPPENMTPVYQSMSFPSVPSFSDPSTTNDDSTQTSQEST
jgi:hypothetical protein